MQPALEAIRFNVTFLLWALLQTFVCAPKSPLRTECHTLFHCDLITTSPQVMLTSAQNILLEKQTFTPTQMNGLSQASCYFILSFGHDKRKRSSTLQFYDGVSKFLSISLLQFYCFVSPLRSAIMLSYYFCYWHMAFQALARRQSP